MKIRIDAFEAAERGEAWGVRALVAWWAWNDPNGLWNEALAYMDGVDPDDNPEGWDPVSVAKELCDQTRAHLGDDFNEYVG